MFLSKSTVTSENVSHIYFVPNYYITFAVYLQPIPSDESVQDIWLANMPIDRILTGVPPPPPSDPPLVWNWKKYLNGIVGLTINISVTVWMLQNVVVSLTLHTSAQWCSFYGLSYGKVAEYNSAQKSVKLPGQNQVLDSQTKMACFTSVAELANFGLQSLASLSKYRIRTWNLLHRIQHNRNCKLYHDKCFSELNFLHGNLKNPNGSCWQMYSSIANVSTHEGYFAFRSNQRFPSVFSPWYSFVYIYMISRVQKSTSHNSFAHFF